ncbi:NHLP leader peptide family RiPP precursor, partial [Scytonema sp. NUACC26]|uniref:NHLP leader peptide family RiPP precursor n=1 Tax=Scytonema sp. NUACC26 TaxID=3140176 RepID=UPI0038B33249
EFELELIAKSWKDQAFKQELLNNPKAVYARELQQELPQGLEIRVLEETPSTLYLVIPRNPMNAQVTEDLSEEALESVAGGGFVGGISVIAEGHLIT